MFNTVRNFLNELDIVTVISILILIFITSLIGVYYYQDITYGAHYGEIIDKRYTPTVSSYSKGSFYYYGKNYAFLIEKNNKNIWISVTGDEYNNLNIGECYIKCE